jgi:hypothetical protein
LKASYLFHLPHQMSSNARNKIIFCFDVATVFLFKTSFHTEMLCFAGALQGDPLQQPLVAFVSAGNLDKRLKGV